MVDPSNPLTPPTGPTPEESLLAELQHLVSAVDRLGGSVNLMAHGARSMLARELPEPIDQQPRTGASDVERLKDAAKTDRPDTSFVEELRRVLDGFRPDPGQKPPDWAQQRALPAASSSAQPAGELKSDQEQTKLLTEIRDRANELVRQAVTPPAQQNRPPTDPPGPPTATGAAPDDEPDWYAKFQPLNNRRDMLREGGKSLPEKDEREWERLNARLQQEAYGTPTPGSKPTQGAPQAHPQPKQPTPNPQQTTTATGRPTPNPQPTPTPTPGPTPQQQPQQQTGGMFAAAGANLQRAAQLLMQSATKGHASSQAGTPPKSRTTYPKAKTFLGGVRQKVMRNIGGAFKRSKLGGALAGIGKAIDKYRKAKTPAAKGSAAVAVGGKIAGGAMLAINALAMFRRAVIDAAEASLQAQRKYAEVSASMAAVFAELDRNQTFREMEIGERTSGSAKYLAQATNKSREADKETEILFTTISNNIKAFFVEGFADVKEVIVSPVARAANKFLGAGKPEEGERASTAQDQIEDMDKRAREADRDGRDRMDGIRRYDEERRGGTPNYGGGDWGRG